MQKANLDFVISQAQDERQDTPIGRAVRDSIEVGTVFPSKLRQALAAAGYDLIQDTASMAELGFASMATLKRALVADAKGVIVAMGAAGDHDEALLAAMLGWFRENSLPESDVPAGIGVAPGSATG